MIARIFVLLFLASALFSCAEKETQQGNLGGAGDEDSATATTVNINRERPGNTDDIVIDEWVEGSTISVGGYISKPLNRIDGTVAEFEFAEKFSRPFNVIYPVAAYVDATRVLIGSENPVIPFAAYVGKGQAVWLEPLCGALRIPLKGGYADSETVYNLSKVEVRGARGEQMSGVFELDYRNMVLKSADDKPESRVVSSDHSVELSSELEKEIEVIIPAGEYESGLVLTFYATDNTKVEYTTQTSFVVEAGNYNDLSLIWYRPDAVQSNISGYVKDTSGNPLSGVVVSDGLNSAKTDRDGKYTLPLAPEEYQPKFVYISSPSTHSVPIVNGIPKFYKTWEECKMLQSVDFELTPISGNPDRYTIFMVADPQIRSSRSIYDKIAYHSIDAMKDTFRDVRECALSITDRNCYGFVLGDVVHEDMTLFPEHIAQCKTLNFPMYSIIGNHDHDSSETGEEVQHAPYELALGPRNYSLNLGRFHVVCVDNILMNPNPVAGEDISYKIGLNNTDMQWLRNDLSYVPETTPVIICSHSTMFMKATGSDVSKNAPNGSEYAKLLSRYKKVYNFAGHAHTSFNYVYPATSEKSNMEVHIVPRCGGILWLNEYIADGGVPRGYLVCEVNGENMTWKFRPIPYLTGPNLSNIVPNYRHRLWSYIGDTAYIGSSILNDSHQIQTYGGGVYPDGKIYASVYMWDEAWGDVYLQVAGGGRYKMEKVPVSDPYAYDASDKETIEHYLKYQNNPGTFKKEPTTWISHMFRVKPDESTGTGVVTVTDRFGETYSQKVSW